jgi:hypothetical protein
MDRTMIVRPGCRSSRTTTWKVNSETRCTKPSFLRFHNRLIIVRFSSSPDALAGLGWTLRVP